MLEAMEKAIVQPAQLNLTSGGKTYVELDRSEQVLRVDVPEDVDVFEDFGYGETGKTPAKLYPSAAALDSLGPMTSAALLALKAKQFDDGLYAAVEAAVSKGMGDLRSRDKWLTELCAAVSGEGAALLSAAIEVGGGERATGRGAELLETFLRDPFRSKPISFYTWNQELAQAFRRDRMLQSELEPDTASALASAIRADPKRRAAYEAMLQLNAKLTNPPATPDLLAEASGEKLALLPPSRAHETDLIKRLYGDTPIPEGFDLADELIKRLRSGEIDLTPTEESGWYDHLSYALEPIAAPERMPEGKRLSLSDSYRKELEGLFKALLALTRETHAKQLEMPMVGAARGPAPPPRLEIAPNLSTEPLASYYLRRAKSYAFVREVLAQSFGEPALGEMRRLTAGGPINMTLADELTLFTRLFYGAYLITAAEIGLAPEHDASLGDADKARAVYGGWREKIRRDPDLAADIRMMVPVFYDVRRRKTKVWAVLGLATRQLIVSFAKKPAVVSVRGARTLRSAARGLFPAARRRPDDAGAELDIDWISESHNLVYIASAELYVDKILNRQELRELCDKYGTYDAIVEALK